MSAGSRRLRHPGAPRVGVVVVAHGPEPHLEACLRAIASSHGVDVELVVVDNACTHSGLRALVEQAGGRLLGPSVNRGFAGGCNAGAKALTSPSLVLINSDAVVAPTALAALTAALGSDVGLVTSSLRLAREPDRLNSAGNPVHFLGLSWAGGFGSLAGDDPELRPVASASGAAMSIDRMLYDHLGGFDEEYFTYVEDTELSLRVWLAGRTVVIAPGAVVLHHYEFSRNGAKLFYLERNRLLMVLTVFERRTLLLLAPALLGLELAMSVLAWRQGWLRDKAAGWRWLYVHRAHIKHRRRTVQAGRQLRDRSLVPLLEARIAATNIGRPPGLGSVNALLAAYWMIARRFV